MIEWTELATLPGPGGPSWVAIATTEDGTELKVEVWGPRPGSGLKSLLAPAREDPPAPMWRLIAKGRAPTTLELLDATTHACRNSPEWWALPLPWRGDVEALDGAEYYVLQGIFTGPIRPGSSARILVDLGSSAPTSISAAGRA